MSYSGRIEMAQHGTRFVGLTWDCGDEEIIVTAIKFPRGTGFRLVAGNDHSMTVSGTLAPRAAVNHRCGREVEDAPSTASGIRKLIDEVRTLCAKAPRLCDEVYDVNIKRAATATRG